MNRTKKTAWVLLGTAVVLLAEWFNLPMNKLKGNEQKLAQILASDEWYSRVDDCSL